MLLSCGAVSAPGRPAAHRVEAAGPAPPPVRPPDVRPPDDPAETEGGSLATSGASLPTRSALVRAPEAASERVAASRPPSPRPWAAAPGRGPLREEEGRPSLEGLLAETLTARGSESPPPRRRRRTIAHRDRTARRLPPRVARKVARTTRRTCAAGRREKGEHGGGAGGAGGQATGDGMQVGRDWRWRCEVCGVRSFPCRKTWPPIVLSFLEFQIGTIILKHNL